MLQFILKRLGLAILVAFTVSFISFSLLFLSGDPAAALAGETASGEDIEALRRLYGFDRPMLVQYGEWLFSAIQGDFGESYYFRLPVASLIADRLSVTMTLGVCGIVFALLTAVPLGVVAAIRPNSIIDRVALFISVAGQAMPSFWFGLILIVIFAIQLGWLPPSGTDTWRHFILPTIVLGTIPLAVIARQTRSAMLEVLGEDYIRTARAKGMSPGRINGIHALRNALIPVITVIGLSVGTLLAGAILTETIFSWPGIGKWMVDSIFRRDYPVVQGGLLLIAVMVMVVNLTVDMLYGIINPKIRKR